jgi:hypothetical protein
MTASRLLRATIPAALVFLASARVFAGPITAVVTVNTVANINTLIPSGNGNIVAFNPGLVNVQPKPCISNIGNFSDPSPVGGTIADADGLLAGFASKLPFQRQD